MPLYKTHSKTITFNIAHQNELIQFTANFLGILNPELFTSVLTS